ncbi:helix-turn-helix domain-containing protein [Marinobacter sp. F4216]|uniref:helix-turn-helix domain-containing protein n=1 Tax=Marinobacter sp. F4216 TaxID=2874281 RepID=UPI0029585262|nr:helix-turn-helix domain-containing protein [Marinobacter sp. F4216]MBZ2168134.1 winged helix-turn-helix domain-containing protein [Marinobacter sp. F4216]
MNESPSKTKTSFYRRLYISWLISSGTNSIPAIIEATGMPRRTAQDTINALHEIDVHIEHVGSTKAGHYEVKDWGAINPEWLATNVERLRETLGYPPLAS